MLQSGFCTGCCGVPATANERPKWPQSSVPRMRAKDRARRCGRSFKQRYRAITLSASLSFGAQGSLSSIARRSPVRPFVFQASASFSNPTSPCIA
ncbi:hypothetical protein B0H67DRAFT_154477 [Lasiosphaeris hirsuta]|uniref:Uncharacterized protein n=1 Tax=Lasiosphaeris hirsuta TaxID=260670 RepID=A0AA40APB0_9PEZI|nr:hypothetical protein B0H67DRAFT_154477 [Lasiosphaeris hirsuta]